MEPSLSGNAQSPRTSAWQRSQWAIFLSLTALTLGASLAGSRLAGYYLRPPGFVAFRLGLYVQQALLDALLLSVLGLVAGWTRVPRGVARLLFGVYMAGHLWYCLWGVVRTIFGIELTPRWIDDFARHPDVVAMVGLSSWSFWTILAASVALAAGLGYLAAALAGRAGAAGRRRACLVAAVLFVLVHVPVRAYAFFHERRLQYAVMALDDSIPYAPKPERLVPGLATTRLRIPNSEDPQRTSAWIDAMRARRYPPVPRPYSILWIAIESWRVDAPEPELSPRLWAKRDAFQVRLGPGHWSGGNTSKFGIFSMLTGLSGYHLQTLLGEGVRYPLLELLSQSGYRIRFAKANALWSAVIPPFVPAGAEIVSIEGDGLAETDDGMVRSLLADRAVRDRSRPSFEWVTFDSPHWPYHFPANEAPFGSAEISRSPLYNPRSPAEVAPSFNRYKNAIRFVDDRIGRILDDLALTGDLDRTIVIIAGDHGEEFLERGQFSHSSSMNEFQGRAPLWIHVPGDRAPVTEREWPSTHLDIVPTILDALGFEADVLYTQGRSLFGPEEPRPLLLLSEQGYFFPFYHAAVSPEFISRWRQGKDFWMFSGIERRDGRTLEPNATWLPEVESGLRSASLLYEVLPDPNQDPRPFRGASVGAPQIGASFPAARSLDQK